MPDRPLIQLLTWLSSITTWKRAFITITLGAAVLVGTLTYKHPQQILDVIHVALYKEPCVGSHVYMTPLWTDAQREVDHLEQTLGPAMIGVIAWRVDLDANRQHMVAYAVTDDYRDLAQQIAKKRWQADLPLFDSNPVVNHVLGLIISGRFACADAQDAWPALRRFPLAEVCLIGIPPDEGNGLGGFLGGGWHDPISDEERERIEAAFRSAASALVWRTRAR